MTEFFGPWAIKIVSPDGSISIGPAHLALTHVHVTQNILTACCAGRHDLGPAEREAIHMRFAKLVTAAPELLASLQAAEAALRSYQHGNAGRDLANEIADLCVTTIRKVEAKPLIEIAAQDRREASR